MKSNFTCPKCKKGIRVGKKLHGSYKCPNCHYAMVLSREDVNKGTIPYRNPFQGSSNFKKPFNRNFKKPFSKSHGEQIKTIAD